MMILASALFSYCANNFFLFVDASKNTGESPGLLLRAAGCGIHYGQVFSISSAVYGGQHAYSHMPSGFIKGLACPPGLANYGV